MKIWDVHGTYKGERVRVTVWATTYGRAFVEAMRAYPELIADRAFCIHRCPEVQP